ncbi:MAG TPA: response regulator [Pyrinomonadaceae bacterium]
MTTPQPRILCVDDHDDTCLLLSALLGGSGYEVKHAGSVGEALGVAREEHFDLFVLDSRYPDGSGVELCRQLRQVRPQAPVVFYSGAALAEDEALGLGAGAEAYVVKPEIDGLLTAVERVLRGQGAGL